MTCVNLHDKLVFSLVRCAGKIYSSLVDLFGFFLFIYDAFIVFYPKGSADLILVYKTVGRHRDDFCDSEITPSSDEDVTFYRIQGLFHVNIRLEIIFTRCEQKQNGQ